jgi:hypothetical protein
MREAGAEDWEVNDFRWGMNRVRLAVYERLFRAGAKELGLEVRLSRSWSGVTDEKNLEHPNFALASKTYSRDELLTRGMMVLLQKRHGR